MPNPGFLVKKIPTWKMTVKAWDNEEFKNQMALLFDELNEVGSIFLHITLSNTDGSRRSSTSRKSRLTWLTRRTIRRR